MKVMFNIDNRNQLNCAIFGVSFFHPPLTFKENIMTSDFFFLVMDGKVEFTCVQHHIYTSVKLVMVKENNGVPGN